ncbi:hypothetical protein EGT74_03145 [Chitinophaga lutea]|uniref:Uncharacterized protein n=1 Tax=Chitinophaga lutea TaxID=2488634 RepID=A0A3N4PUV0_9BACT|nr:hypothetical protein [Chitinophaga lutea]RPE12563.1 hypothetical protein EGT74_03145 [Chitinophaga lutea]
MDLGNGKHTGQVLFSAIGKVEQLTSRKSAPVAKLPIATNEFNAQMQPHRNIYRFFENRIIAPIFELVASVTDDSINI